MTLHQLVTQTVLGDALINQKAELIALCLKAIWEDWPEKDETGVLATRANHSMTCFAVLRSLGWSHQVVDEKLVLFTPAGDVWTPNT